MTDLNKYHGAPRLRCSGGQSSFFIHSNGDVSRCASYYYDMGNVMGNAMDSAFRKSVEEGASHTFTCPVGTCISECDGHHNTQDISCRDGVVVHHTAERSEAKGLVGKRHCILQVSITSTCNMSCSYCCADASMKAYAGTDLSPEAWEDIASFFVSVFPEGNASMLGGEPTVHPGLKRHAAMLLAHGWHVDLFTNMSLPKKVFELVEHVDGRLPRLFVIISLHPTQRQFSLQKIVDAAKTLDSMGVRYGYSFVSTTDNDQLDRDLNMSNVLSSQTRPVWFNKIRNVRTALPAHGA